MGLVVNHDTVKFIFEGVEELKLEVDSLNKSLGHLIDIYGPLVFKVNVETAIHNLGLGKNQAGIYLKQISRIKKSLATLELHLRGYDSVCSIAREELKGIE